MGIKNRNITGVLGFDVGRTITAPNATIPVHYIVPNGSEANLDLALCPKGTGAITAQIPDGTSAGGNKRGSNAVDLQTSRGAATQVASATTSAVLGGSSNKATAQYALVCGGSTNSATGNASFIGGGSSNTAGGNRAVIGGGSSNTASNACSVVGGGENNSASGSYSVIGGGYMLVVNAQYAFAGGGMTNSATGSYASTTGGYCNSASGQFSCITGGNFLRAYLLGQAVLGGYSTGGGQTRQDSKLTMQKVTTDALTSEMTIDATTRAVLKNNCAWAFDITILAHSSTNVLHTARFKRSGLILRGASAATTTLEGAVQTIGTDIINSNLSGCAVNVSADSSNGSLKVEVTGIASTTIIWQAKIELVEIEI